MSLIFAEGLASGKDFFESHSGEIILIIIFALVLGTLLIVVPQLLRARNHHLELDHAEHLRALETGQTIRRPDPGVRAAGQTAALVPMVAVCAAGTVTCFLTAYRSESLFSVSLAVWSVAGVVSLAAITGGVALMGRIAQLNAGLLEEESQEEGMENSDQGEGQISR
jgi:hypothetical protein